jgi:hypothetical protein
MPILQKQFMGKTWQLQRDFAFICFRQDFFVAFLLVD